MTGVQTCALPIYFITIEEKIIKLQQMKKELAEEILSGDEIKTASFQREELLELLEERF